MSTDFPPPRGRDPFNFSDRSEWCFYDWLVLPPRCETQSFYSLHTTPVGMPAREHERQGPDKRRSYADTNVEQSGQLLYVPQSFVARSIHAFFGTTADEDRDRFREAYTLEFIIGEKTYYRIPLVAIPAHGCYLSDDFMQPIPEDWPKPQPGDFGDYPRYIPALMHSRMQLIGNPITIDPRGFGLRFLPVLLGTLEREVQ